MDDGKSFDYGSYGVHYISGGYQIVILMIALILHVIGYATNAWGVAKALDPENRLGIWETCYCTDTTPSLDWFKAFQALITISGLCLCGAILLGFIYTFCKGFAKTWLIAVFVFILIASVVCAIIGYALFAVELLAPMTVSYSYVLHVIGTLFIIVACVITLVQWQKLNSY